ncbi:lipoprotein lipase isoform X2 [Megachile rotundata]|uniref:lipoprotein lipase isoform X2 n=1 Tax=Megachile rotundata TaxID=143995 RepID=UPI003FCF5F1D
MAKCQIQAIGKAIGAIANVTHTQPDIYIEDEHGEIVKIDLSLIGSGRSLVVEDLQDLVNFYLYTNETGTDAERLYINDTEAFNSSHFDLSRPTKVATHGWRSSYNASACTLVRDAYLKHGNYNIIVIDWSQLAYYDYVFLSQELPKIAQHISTFLNFLYSQGVDADNVTVVGHSLGAHIAGLSSYYATERAGYIVGLDPAGPLFTLKDERGRISELDGEYVLIIHTTCTIGLCNELGHADFYPNGAILQAGCTNGEVCGHGRAYEYFAESILYNDFPARKCDNYVEFELGLCNSNDIAYMGGAELNSNVTGKYFLNTNSKSLYGKGSI